MGIADNEAFRCLTENLGQPCDRHRTAIDYVCENLSRPNRW